MQVSASDPESTAEDVTSLAGAKADGVVSAVRSTADGAASATGVMRRLRKGWRRLRKGWRRPSDP